MNKAIQIRENGGPEVLRLEEGEIGKPAEGQVLLSHAAIGVNFIDVYHRTGLYPLPKPHGLGIEGAGVVEEVGSGVTNFRKGDRVAYAGGAPGAYAERRVMAASQLVLLPAGIGFTEAAATLLQGMTVYSLIHRTAKVSKGDVVLWHAAAGGVGLLACQWLRSLGVNVIGTVSNDEKAELARANGCTHTIVYTRENFAERVREITDGAGVPVVFDSVGKVTWEGSLDCLSPMGLMVSFGNASGPVDPFSISQLATKGSLYVTRPVLGAYIAERRHLETAANSLFQKIESGEVKAHVNQNFPLAEAASAHAALEGRMTTGATVLMP